MCGYQTPPGSVTLIPIQRLPTLRIRANNNHAMLYTTVFCIAVSHAQADYIIDRLKEAGFSHRDIAVLLGDPGTAHWNHPPVAAGRGRGAGAGMRPVPEACLYMAAGPILAALCGSLGAAMDVGGGLFGLGLPANHTQRLEGRIRDGGILITVHTGSAAQIARTKGIFAQAGAHDICCADASDAPRARMAPTRASHRAGYTVGYLT